MGFRLTKVQLIAYFLATRLKNGAIPQCYPQFIDYDVYTDHPFNIMTSTMDRRGANDVDEGFFFSRLNESTRTNRPIKGHGTWQQKSKTNKVCIGKNIVVGEEKYFKFKPKDNNGNGNGNEDEWTMHEYYVDGNDEMVLCHITKKSRFIKTLSLLNGAQDNNTKEFDDINNTIIKFDESMNVYLDIN